MKTFLLVMSALNAAIVVLAFVLDKVSVVTLFNGVVTVVCFVAAGSKR